MVSRRGMPARLDGVQDSDGGGRGPVALAVFKIVARRPSSPSRVGSTPMHSRCTLTQPPTSAAAAVLSL